jgi:hypothetical protein
MATFAHAHAMFFQCNLSVFPASAFLCPFTYELIVFPESSAWIKTQTAAPYLNEK